MEIRKYFSSKNSIYLLGAWQFVSVLLMVLGIWPSWLGWVNTALVSLFVIFADSFYALLLLILSVPFYTALPNHYSETLAGWRIPFILCFLAWAYRHKFVEKKGFKKIRENMFVWDYLLVIFFAVSILTLAFAQFKFAGFKQIAFWLNIYLLYVVLANAIKKKQQVVEIIKYSALSLVVVGFLGYLQLFATFFVSFENFTRYWANHVSRIYYGISFSSVLQYSNSWFSYDRQRDLRMFSVLPDSHSFALLMVFGMGFVITVTFLYQRKVGYYLWSLIRFGGLAIILSGTRAVWVGLFPPFIAAALAIKENFAKTLAKKTLWLYLLIIFFFIISPLINHGLAIFRFEKFRENFIDRARSIPSFKQDSNLKILKSWQDSFSYGLEHPWGTGVANFLVSLSPQPKGHANFRQLAERRDPDFNLPQRYVSAHSLYLQAFVETGALGLLAILAFIISYLRQIWVFLKANHGDNNIFIFFVMQGALIFMWIFTASFFDIALLNDRVLMFFFICLGLSGIILRNYQTLKDETN